MNKLAQPKMWLTAHLLCAVMLFAACTSKETVVVPNSDTTTPTVSMTVFFTPSGSSLGKTVELTANSESVSFELNPAHPFSIVASATDEESGVMGIQVGGSYTVLCAGNHEGAIVEMPPSVPDIGGPGDTVPIGRGASFSYDPKADCPDGNSETGGQLWAYAENYLNMPAQTATFSFHYHP